MSSQLKTRELEKQRRKEAKGNTVSLALSVSSPVALMVRGEAESLSFMEIENGNWGFSSDVHRKAFFPNTVDGRRAVPGI